MKPVSYNLATASELSDITYLTGYTFEENAGTPAAARVEIRKGSATGDLIDVVILAADGRSSRDYTAPIKVPGGVYVQVASGSVQGAVYGG